MNRLRRRRSEEGSAVTEAVLITPALLLLVLLIVQMGVWFHAQHVVRAAAEEGVRVARAERGTARDGEATATGFLEQSGASIVTGRTIAATRAGVTATVTVSGHAATVVPGFRLPVHATASSPIESFRSPR